MRRGRNAYHLCDYLISVSRQRLRRGTRWAVLAVPGSAARRTALRSFSALPPGRGGHHLGCRVRGDAVGRPRLAPDSHRGGGATVVVTPPVRFPGCEPARGGHCDCRHCPEAAVGSGWLRGRTGYRAALARAPCTEPHAGHADAGHADVGLGENPPPSGTRVHAVAAAPARARDDPSP
jgi:hypothetical protein